MLYSVSTDYNIGIDLSIMSASVSVIDNFFGYDPFCDPANGNVFAIR